jgi:transcriptional regulator with XRE-family HTH domain
MMDRVNVVDLAQQRTDRRRGRGHRTELAAFLRSRRGRITPEMVGLPPGPRRRTPGLRREEVAQLSGIGITWYTWLEQGRRINVSVQVLDAVARTLQLDADERVHLYHLAGVPTVPSPDDPGELPDEIRVIVDGLSDMPAAVYRGRFDILATNETYRRLFGGLGGPDSTDRNVLRLLFTRPDCCNPFVNRAEELPRLVAQLRSISGRHLGDPAWQEYVRDLCERSPEFARMWANHDVASPGTRIKVFRHSAIGEVRMMSTSMSLAVPPEARLIVYTPLDDECRERLAYLRGLDDTTARRTLGHDHDHV